MIERPQFNQELYSSIAKIIIDAKTQVYRSSNTILLKMYWEIGKLIIEDEQDGKFRAKYGKSVLRNLAEQISLEFGKGFNERNLNNMRAFFIAFPIWNAVRTELSWTHYRIISRVENPEHRVQYIEHSIEGNWNTRTLQRNIDSQYLGRLLKLPRQESKEVSNFIKDPYIFEFLGLPSDIAQTETQIESALITHLQKFLMELGKGFAFVARQQHIVTDTSDFFVDLIFYNYYLKCFVLVDLKTHKLTHEAIGQMDMYVRMYNDLKKGADDNPTIGIILCTEKDETVVKYSVMSDNEKLFASKYRTYLPDEGELKQLIEADRVKFQLDNQD
ncbi:PDDEXK nuclease domain-containing protein [Chryseobacterium fluminis]|uniref:PDDEXK nuclease domain-containing protein n=1 Tax=Chryseobacterium fluminis TaxID=2983606 RepID=UPI002255DBE7|nr:PDDEXK nuclease domain-containing protein [Chryseobacterium sp. MMS21-Ot14]UZU00039.1 PDDEXK nuclease domain-containing protein [Chryseobacterium sp. MMS21-Ot14]